MGKTVHNLLAKSTILLLLSAPLILHSQSVELYAPNTGSAFFPESRSLRLIVGIPGAAYVGSTLFSDVSFASMAPDQRSVLLLREGRGSFQSSSQPIFKDLKGNLLSQIEKITWSPTGTYAILASNAQQAVQRIEILPSEIRAGDLIQLDQDILATAVSGDGNQMIAGTTTGFHLIQANGVPSLLLKADQPRRATFTKNGESLYLLADGAVYRFHLASTALEKLTFLPHADYTDMAIDSDDRALILARGSNVHIFDLVSQQLLAEHSVELARVAFEPLSNGRMILLNPLQDRKSTLYLLDTRMNAVYFIPAPEKESL